MNPNQKMIIKLQKPNKQKNFLSKDEINKYVKPFFRFQERAIENETTTLDILKGVSIPENNEKILSKLLKILNRIEKADEINSDWLNNPAVAQLAILLSTVKDDIKHLSSDNPSTQPKYSLKTIHPALGSKA